MINELKELAIAGLKVVEIDDYFDWASQPDSICKPDCGCKICSMYRRADNPVFDPPSHEVVQPSKCSKKACKKYGCECGW